MDSISRSRHGIPKLELKIVYGNRAAPQSRKELRTVLPFLIAIFSQKRVRERVRIVNTDAVNATGEVGCARPFRRAIACSR